MSPGSDFPSFLASVRDSIDETLDRLLPPSSEEPRRVHEAMRYSLLAGGKRLRPALTLLTGESLGVERQKLLPGAAAIEMIHTYSLIHDDLPAMDDDDLRRGQPTVHRKFDEATAILAGDALLTLGLTALAIHPEEGSAEQRRRAVELLGKAIGSRGMIGGQALDMAAENAWPEDAGAVLEAIHRQKTGALLSASVRLAGIYAGVGTETDRLLSWIGDGIGLLFQIADDILDVVGDSETLGKTAGKDAAARKLTYPGLYGLEESQEMLRQAQEQTLKLVRKLPRDGALFVSLMQYLVNRDR